MSEKQKALLDIINGLREVLNGVERYVLAQDNKIEQGITVLNDVPDSDAIVNTVTATIQREQDRARSAGRQNTTPNTVAVMSMDNGDIYKLLDEGEQEFKVLTYLDEQAYVDKSYYYPLTRSQLEYLERIAEKDRVKAYRNNYLKR